VSVKFEDDELIEAVTVNTEVFDEAVALKGLSLFRFLGKCDRVTRQGVSRKSCIV
jgi:hypothetical protein